MTRRNGFFLILLTLLLSACGGAAMPSMQAPAAAPTSAPAAAAQPASDSALGEGVGKAAPGQSEQSAVEAIERMVIKNADLRLQVDNVAAAEAAVREKVAQYGGYVVKAESSGTDEDTTLEITFRVPANRFDEVLGGVQGLAQRVLARTISGDDVTEQYVDLESRLKNLEATRERLLGFLDRATKVEDALAVNQSLSEVQGEIEQIKGRMQYLKQSSALSTISVALFPVPTTRVVTHGGWQPMEVARGALRELLELGQGLVNLLIVLLIWTPVWLPPLLFGLWLRRRWRARKPAPVA